MGENIIKISNLKFAHQNFPIFKNLNIDIQKNKITAIMGPSGSGKTTLLRLIGALLKPDAGNILINNTNINTLNSKALNKLRKDMGLLFQNGALFTHLNVFENVAFPLREHTNLTKALLTPIVLMKLESVGLRGVAYKMPDELSGGMARRVALARAIALDPKIMLYDEPFTGQDPISMAILLKLIKKLNLLLKTTTIIVSHDVEETCQIADYIYLLAEGEVIGQGTPIDLKNSNLPRVKQFMQAQPDGAVPFHYPAKPYLEELLND